MTLAHEGDKIIAFEKGPVLFVFSFHPEQTFIGYQVGTSWNADHKVLYSSDDSVFGGHESCFPYPEWIQVHSNEGLHNRNHKIYVDIPPRSMLALISRDNFQKLDLQRVLAAAGP